MKVNIQHVAELACPLCQAELDAASYKPLTRQACPACGGTITIPGQFQNYILHQRLRHEPLSVKFGAFDLTLERAVTLRLINPESDPALIYSLMEINRKLSALNHRHIAKVHRVDKAEDVVYIEGELLQTASLRDVIRSTHEVSEIEAISLALDIAMGLDSAHQKNVFHLNLHPGMVRFDASGTLKLIDFAHYRLQETRRKLIGQPAYVSPEAVLYAANTESALKPGAQADIFSLGVILYELLTGKSPYLNGNDQDNMEVIRRRFRELPPPVTELKELDEDSAVIVDAMIAPDINERYASMQDVVSDLDKHLQFLIEQLGPLYQGRINTLAAISQDIEPATYGDESLRIDIGDETLSEGLSSVISDVRMNPSETIVTPAAPEVADQSTQPVGPVAPVASAGSASPSVINSEDAGEGTAIEWPKHMPEGDAEQASTDGQEQGDLAGTNDPEVMELRDADLSSIIEPAAAAAAASNGPEAASHSTGLPSITSRSAGRRTDSRLTSRSTTGTQSFHRRSAHQRPAQASSEFPLVPLIGGIAFGLCALLIGLFVITKPKVPDDLGEPLAANHMDKQVDDQVAEQVDDQAGHEAGHQVEKKPKAPNQASSQKAHTAHTGNSSKLPAKQANTKSQQQTSKTVNIKLPIRKMMQNALTLKLKAGEVEVGGQPSDGPVKVIILGDLLPDGSFKPKHQHKSAEGTLTWLMTHSPLKERFAYLGKSGAWSVRSDLNVSNIHFRKTTGYQHVVPLKTDNPSFAIGPHLTIGHVAGNYYDERVLLIHIRTFDYELFSQWLKSQLSALSDYDLIGLIFVPWHQKNNMPMTSDQVTEFLSPLRRDIGKPDLRYIIAEVDAKSREAHRTAVQRLAPARYVETAEFLRPGQKKSAGPWGRVTANNLLVGEALAKAAIEMAEAR